MAVSASGCQGGASPNSMRLTSSGLQTASNCLHVQAEVDGGKVEVNGEWNLASTLLPVTIDGTERTLQVRSQCFSGTHKTGGVKVHL